MSTSWSEERVESTGAAAIKDEVKDALDLSADESAPSDLKGLFRIGSIRPDLDSGLLDSECHWGSERPTNYDYLTYNLRKKRGSPPPSEELYESFRFAAATMNGNESAIFNAAKVFFKDRDKIDGNEIRKHGQMIQREFESPTPYLVGGFRVGQEYLEELYERFDGAADTTRDERTQSPAHSAEQRTPNDTSFGYVAARLRCIGAYFVEERRLAIRCLKRWSPNAAYYRFDEKDHAHVFTFIISESCITLFANFGRTGSNVEAQDEAGIYLEYHMSELLCLSPATSYETFKEAWTALRNAEEYSKQPFVPIDLEKQKSVQVAAWEAFDTEKKNDDTEDFKSVLARRRMLAIEAWRSEEEMIKSRRNLDGMGPDDREAYFKLQQVRYH
ncbi:uncharacterized protein EAF01_010505 [Botrytis porri]|uniref:Uncharacterized protein n=1 Tax=Botrytis porri TaxID=87229 RepID=A0A4Z1L3Y8_9HELO|nr:uncharacterized protein EAF01_010505 [Botrytis porri]KAF7892425.1 hypothetical protein EAF01_010505 [Botrytis porri]TGO91498.1 hypothetical protein BPOR_0026g00220 [Botrytis porri]